MPEDELAARADTPEEPPSEPPVEPAVEPPVEPLVHDPAITVLTRHIERLERDLDGMRERVAAHDVVVG